MRLTLILVCLTTMGCGGGPKTVPVSGTITLDNEPLANVVVTFKPLDVGLEEVITSTGTTDDSGNYRLSTISINNPKEGAVVGKHQVSIGQNLEVDEGAEDADVAVTEETTDLPAHDFTFEVKEATDQANFNLETKS